MRINFRNSNFNTQNIGFSISFVILLICSIYFINKFLDEKVIIIGELKNEISIVDTTKKNYNIKKNYRLEFKNITAVQHFFCKSQTNKIDPLFNISALIILFFIVILSFKLNEENYLRIKLSKLLNKIALIIFIFSTILTIRNFWFINFIELKTNNLYDFVNLFDNTLPQLIMYFGILIGLLARVLSKGEKLQQDKDLTI